jgi:hypothetical protein
MYGYTPGGGGGAEGVPTANQFCFCTIRGFYSVILFPKFCCTLLCSGQERTRTNEGMRPWLVYGVGRI